jgi:hypothetical protein
MKSIHLQMTVNSETLHVPELKPLIGQMVDIIILPLGEGKSAPTEWLPGFWEKMSGGWQGEPLVRPEQGKPDIRDVLQ